MFIYNGGLKIMKTRTFMRIQILLITIIFISTQFGIAFESNYNTSDETINTVSFPSSYYKIPTDEPVSILYPRTSIPAIVEPQQEILIQLKSIPFNTVLASIETAYDPLPFSYQLIIESIEETNNVFYIKAIIPEDALPELYNLTIIVHTEGEIYSQTRPRAISIKDQITDSFSFIHIADFHIGDPRGLIENPKETIGWKAARKTIEEVNLLNPDFVIITGDLVFGQAYPFEYTLEYKKCYEILQEFQVPTFLSLGNHDGYNQMGQDGLVFWQYYFGPLYYSFNFGESHFISVNSYDMPKRLRTAISFIAFNWGGYIQSEQMQWIEDDLQNNMDKYQISMMMHHNPIWDTTSESLFKNTPYEGREELLQLIDDYNVDMVFAGHVHYDDVTEQDDTLFITTNTIASSLDTEDGYWGYRMITIQNGAIESINYKEPKYCIPSYRLNQTIIDQYSFTIENDLQQDIPFFKEFIVPSDEYTVNHGDIIQIREKEGMAAIYVAGIIEQESMKTITLS